MDVTAASHRLAWRSAVVEAIEVLTPRVKSFRLRPEGWTRFLAGQHVDIRLTAEDGYSAQRSYSIGSAPDTSGTIELAIEEMTGGEVSPFFHEVVEIGDEIELRGPIGGYFNWDAENGGPILLIGGGSGLVPLMSILRHRAAVAPQVPATLICSARSYEELIWREELLRRRDGDANFRLIVHLTRDAQRDGMIAGRIDAESIAEAIGPSPPLTTYVCGSNPFVSVASDLAVAAGLDPATIRTERYGG